MERSMLPDMRYDIYRFTLKEYLRYILQGFLFIIVLGCLFYQSLSGILLLCPLLPVYCRAKKNQLAGLRKWKLNMEFKDGIVSLAAALSAGYSAEHAFTEAIKDLRLMYQENSIIIREFTFLANRIQMNIPVEKALQDFGDRSGIEDIISFSEVFSTAKRTGGDLVRIIKTTSNAISDKIEVKRDIMTIIAAKKYEAAIMKMVPAGILCYLSLSSPGFLDPLYHNVFGIVVMTLLLLAYLGTYYLIDKITAIEV